MWIIDIITIAHLISTAILFIKGFDGKLLSINKDLIGQAGSGKTYIECLINISDKSSVSEVTINAFTNKTSIAIILYKNNSTNILRAGKYLRGRVTYNTITERSNRTELRFSRLLCEDDKDYQCHLLYTPDPQVPSTTAVSELSHLTVTIPPSRPNNITVAKHNDTFVGSRSSEHLFENLTFVEGDTITATCAGEVGKPPANLTVQKILSNGTACTLTPDDRDNNEFPNCSFLQTSNFTTTLYGEDNEATLRCGVEGLINIDDKVIETSHITVLYPVRIPDVIKFPSTSSRPPVTLHCQGFGNPHPDYTWFKLSNDSLSDELYARNQSITLYNLTDSGVYLCEVNNNIDQHSYSNSRNITVIFDVNSNDPGHSQENVPDQTNLIGVIVGIAVAASIFIVVIVALVVCKKREDSETNKSNEQLIRQRSTKKEKKVYTSNYDTINFDDEIGKKRGPEEVKNPMEEVKQHNDKYMKEHEKAIINSKINSQEVQYAVPQKRRKKELILNTDVDVPVYDKVKKERASNPYASGNGIYDRMNDRRHKKTTDMQQYDTLDSIQDGNSKKQADPHLAGQYVGNEPKHDELDKTMVSHPPNEFAHDDAKKKEAPNQQSINDNRSVIESADTLDTTMDENSKKQTAPPPVTTVACVQTKSNGGPVQNKSNGGPVQTKLNSYPVKTKSKVKFKSNDVSGQQKTNCDSV